MLSPQRLLEILDKLRDQLASGPVADVVFELKVLWEDEVWVRILDLSVSPTPAPPHEIGTTFVYQKSTFSEGLVFIDCPSMERGAYISYHPVLKKYTITEVRGPVSSYDSLTVLSHAIGVLASSGGLDRDNVRTVGRAMLTELRLAPKRQVLNYKGIAHLLHKFHHCSNVRRVEHGESVWTGDHDVQYLMFTLLDPKKSGSEGSVYNLIHRAHYSLGETS